MIRSFRNFVSVLLIAGLVAVLPNSITASLHAQSQSINGTIHGTVIDSSNNPVSSRLDTSIVLSSFPSATAFATVNA